MRLTLSVRATAGPPAARLASPAYLAIDDPEHLRLQVLSPFGVTVLDLATDGDAFTLTLPLRGETRRGRIDLAALAAGTTPDDERMIVALALLFRPKMEQGRCRSAGPGAIACTVASDLTATDPRRREPPRRARGLCRPGRRAAPHGRARGYAGREPDALPGRITISDGRGRTGARDSRCVKVTPDAAPEKIVIFDFTRRARRATVGVSMAAASASSSACDPA